MDNILMLLDALLTTVDGSSRTDWHKMDVNTVYGWTSSSNLQGNFLEPNNHRYLAVYKPDVDISIAFGATIVDPFQEPWTQRYSDPDAASVAIWLRYHGAVVYQETGVLVDGGRYLLPLPRSSGQSYHVKQADMPFARLMFALYEAGGNHQTLESVLASANVSIV